MEKSDLLIVLGQFSEAVNRLGEVLKKDIKQDDSYLDASIHRFEFCFELGWKAMKRVLLSKGIDVRSPKDTFQAALKQGWLSEGDGFWTDLLESRNLTSHTYDVAKAKKIYAKLPSYLNAFQNLSHVLKHQIEEIK